MGNIFKSIIYRCLKNPAVALKCDNVFSLRCQLNVNLDLCNPKQKRILFCYLDLRRYIPCDTIHANYQQAVQMLKCFIEMGFCVDVCFLNDYKTSQYILDYNKKCNSYDIIIGHGSLYKKACKLECNKNTLKILFVTENFPLVVEKKYEERAKYLKQRHPKLDISCSPARRGYFDEEIFTISDYAIVMSSLYNIEPMKNYVHKIYQINSNIIFNKQFTFDKSTRLEAIKNTKKTFLWFGSCGLVHKGVDILLDTFRELPDLDINFYGLSDSEISIFNKLKSKNTNDCGRINVQTQAFIDNVVYKHCFLIMPSCSEGMNTSVATCMAHGIIPIVTKETGFEPCEYIIELKDYKIETLKECINNILAMSDEEILRMSEGAYNYAQENFCLEKFDKSFRKIMKEIVTDNNRIKQ